MTQTPREAHEQPDHLDRPPQTSGSARRHNTPLVALGATVVLVLVAGVVWVANQGSRGGSTRPPPPLNSAAADSSYVRTADRFVGALASFNLAKARQMLAPGATFTGAVDTRQWPVAMRFFRHTGGKILPDHCYVLNRTSSGAVVDCPYSYQLMRSGHLGLGPYTGSTYEITTQDGQVTKVNMDHETDTNGWSAQMWMPFAAWIDAFHHSDGARMYPDWPQQHHWPDTNQAIRLWSLRTRQFVRYARHLCSTPRGQHAAVCAGQLQDASPGT